MKDEAIVQLFWQRSHEAISHTQKNYGGLIHSVCTGILEDARDAEEASSDTYLRLWNSIPPNRPENLKAYAVRVSRNAALDLLRTKKRKKRDIRREILFSELDRCLPDNRDLSERLEEQELAAMINAYLRTLDPVSRSMFIRRYYLMEELDVLSARYGIKKQAVSARLYRIRKGLRAFLEKEGISV